MKIVLEEGPFDRERITIAESIDRDGTVLVPLKDETHIRAVYIRKRWLVEGNYVVERWMFDRLVYSHS